VILQPGQYRTNRSGSRERKRENAAIDEMAILERLRNALHDFSVKREMPNGAISDIRSYKCKQENCGRTGRAGGYCNAHYMRNRAGRRMDSPLSPRRRGQKCSDCGNLTGGKGGLGLCARHFKRKRFQLLKQAAIDSLGGTCQKCLGKFSPPCFDFHHKADKDASVSYLLANGSLAAVAAELAKCDLLCANCHRMEHMDDY